MLTIKHWEKVTLLWMYNYAWNISLVTERYTVWPNDFCFCSVSGPVNIISVSIVNHESLY